MFVAISNISISFLSAFVVSQITRVLLDLKTGIKKTILYHVLGTAIYFSMSNAMIPVVVKQLFIDSGFIAMTYFLYNVKIINAVLCVFISQLAFAIADALIIIGTVEILHYKVELIQSNFPLLTTLRLINIILLLVAIIVFQFIKNRNKKNSSALFQTNISLSVMLYVLVTIVVLLINFTLLQELPLSKQYFIILNMIIILVYLFSSIAVVVSNARLSQKRAENKQLKIYIDTIDALTIELRRFKHNYLNVLHGFGGYIEAEEWESLKKYYYDVLSVQAKDNNTLSLHNIKEYGLLGLLSVKMKTGQELGIDVKLEAPLEIKSVPMKILDLCEVLGIYIDNAIEAVKDLAEKHVKIKFLDDEEYITISVENNFDIKPDMAKIYQNGYSTKGKNRGHGLTIARNILSRYKNVLYNTYVTDELFKQEIIIRKGE